MIKIGKHLDKEVVEIAGKFVVMETRGEEIRRFIITYDTLWTPLPNTNMNQQINPTQSMNPKQSYIRYTSCELGLFCADAHEEFDDYTGDVVITHEVRREDAIAIGRRLWHLHICEYDKPGPSDDDLVEMFLAHFSNKDV